LSAFGFLVLVNKLYGTCWADALVATLAVSIRTATAESKSNNERFATANDGANDLKRIVNYQFSP
jgi:hypothetical protein